MLHATGGTETTKHAKVECVHVQKGLALRRASHFGEIALAGSHRLRSTHSQAVAQCVKILCFQDPLLI